MYIIGHYGTFEAQNMGGGVGAKPLVPYGNSNNTHAPSLLSRSNLSRSSSLPGGVPSFVSPTINVAMGGVYGG